MSDETMKDRAAQAAIATWNDDSPNGKTIAGLRDKFLAFAESEVRAALAPCSPSPELDRKVAHAEVWLCGFRDGNGDRDEDAATILGELDRLRAEVVRLSQPAPAQDRATRVEALREHMFRCGWNVSKEVCAASLDFCDKECE